MVGPSVKTIFACIALMLTVSCVYALTVLALSDEQLVEKSEIIVVGRVLSAYYEMDTKENNPYTRVHVRVSEYLKGKSPVREIMLKTLGGVKGNMALIIPGAADFNRNEEVMLFLERRDDGSLFPVGMVLGKYNIYHDASTGRKVILRLHNGEGKYSAEPREEVLRDLQPEQKVYLDDFRKKIHEFVDRRNKGER